jgi:hypothetical protein
MEIVICFKHVTRVAEEVDFLVLGMFVEAAASFERPQKQLIFLCWGCLWKRLRPLSGRRSS